MSEYFVIRLINDKFYSSWIKIDKKGHYTQEAKFGNLSDAANDLEGKPKIIILIPGSKVSINIAALPTRNNNNIIKSLKSKSDDILLNINLKLLNFISLII